MSSSSKHSSQPFIPSPRWFTESPGGPPSSGNSNSPRQRRNAPSQFEGLWSPVPPPPANLHPGTPDAFNVDPGVPFLATAGSSDVVYSEEESEGESTRRKPSVGGFVTGIRDTMRRSLRRRRSDTLREPAFLERQENLNRDSGYASSPVKAPASAPTRHPSSTEAQTSHEQGIPQAMPAQHYSHHLAYPKFGIDDDYRRNFDAVAELQGRMSLFSGTMTAETASIKYGSDYAKMEAPLDTEDSLSAYIKRTKHFIHQISALPFSSRTRVTYDHFPERDLRDDPRRRPFVEWHRPGSGPTSYSPADESKQGASSMPSQQNPPIYAPHRVPAAEIDLREQLYNTAHATPVGNVDANPQFFPLAVSGPPASFQVIPTGQPPQRQAPVDRSWNEVLSTTTKNLPTVTPFHSAASTERETQVAWQKYPQHRDGYVPPELAETHYGARYGSGIHSARAGPVSLSSVSTSRKHRKS